MTLTSLISAIFHHEKLRTCSEIVVRFLETCHFLLTTSIGQNCLNSIECQ